MQKTQECEDWKNKIVGIEDELNILNEEYAQDEDSLLKQILKMEEEVRQYLETLAQNNTNISLLEVI